MLLRIFFYYLKSFGIPENWILKMLTTFFFAKTFVKEKKALLYQTLDPLTQFVDQSHSEHAKTLKKVQPESKTRQVFFCIIIAIILWNCPACRSLGCLFPVMCIVRQKCFQHSPWIYRWCKLPSFWCWKRCASLTIQKFISNSGEVDEMREKGRGPLKVVAEAALCILRLMRAKLKFMIYFADWKATKFPSKYVAPFGRENSLEFFVKNNIFQTSNWFHYAAPYIKQCRSSDPELVECIKGALMHLRPWLKKGIPEIQVSCRKTNLNAMYMTCNHRKLVLKERTMGKRGRRARSTTFHPLIDFNIFSVNNI